MNNTNIECPACGNKFELTESLRKEVQQDLRQQMKDWQAKRDAEYEAKEKLFEKQKEQAIKEAALLAQQQASEALAQQIKNLQKADEEKAQKLQELNKKELDLMRENRELQQKQQQQETDFEKRMLLKQKEIEDTAIAQEREKFALEKKSMQIQAEQQSKLIEELKRKSEQGSMQLQGESQELVLEEMLTNAFKFDELNEVGKGQRGADCILNIKNRVGQTAGKIIYESKRTKEWSNLWIDKLKTDMRANQCDIAILVTQVYPKDMDRFGEKDGVWLCTMHDVVSLTHILRNGILNVAAAVKSQENKGEKMQMLYNYLTGTEFKGQLEAIAEGFIALRNGITKERAQMEKIWKEREKQIEKVILNTAGMHGSIKGIAGNSVGNIPLLDGDFDELPE
jgi:hypothetical protein